MRVNLGIAGIKLAGGAVGVLLLASCMARYMPVTAIHPQAWEWTGKNAGKNPNVKGALSFKNEQEVYRAALSRGKIDDTPGKKIFPYVSVFQLELETPERLALSLDLTNIVFESAQGKATAYTKSNFFLKYPAKEYDSEKLTQYFSNDTVHLSGNTKASTFLVFEALPKDLKVSALTFQKIRISAETISGSGTNETASPRKAEEWSLRLPLEHERVRAKKGLIATEK